jgi:hypothetical protein
MLRDHGVIRCYVARLNKTFFKVVCKQSVIYFILRVGECVGDAVLKFSVLENLHTHRFYFLIIVSKKYKTIEIC